ncbi:hypothetical protein [Marinobacter zhanjiangensis]|uniref:Uncharacterized protein n=1 Tax=Marinobacter zhanjiangensis TaxID=578215 RepID=A0ABQ3B8G2_9GAMM|nr:hypothetical protein [Marinobacter zhanjiangensis]GGY83331.1 hypothetical protein GCM10007071_33290 [Marinobacter zhanjiangensis]
MNMTRRSPSFLTSLVAVLLLSPASLMAQDGDDLDVTMRMVADDDDLSEGLIQELQLPESPTDIARKGGEDRRDRADNLREQGRSLGREISEEARGRREERSVGRPGSDPGFSPADPRDQTGNDRPAPNEDVGGRPGGRPDTGARP